MNKVIAFIEREKDYYKGHVFIDGVRLMVNTDKKKDIVKSNIEWELNSVYGLENCKITWLKTQMYGGY